MTSDLVGRTVADGRYEVVRQIGQGGMGAVYLARQVTMDRMVALKLIRTEAVKSAEAAARFHREMKLTAKIEHPNTIRVYDFGEIEGQLYLTMELLRGRSLGEVLAESGRLPMDRIVRIATQMARALQAAHTEGVVHRDLKPDNVMLIEQYGEHDVVKVLDFGVAKSLEDDQPRMTQTGAVVGTPMYISPEQALGAAIDPRSDLYSFGIMLYEMACGRVPFTAPSMTALLVAHATEVPAPLTHVTPDVHPGLAALVDELLRKDPAARPQSAKEVVTRLEALAGRAGVPLPVPVPGPAEAPARPRRGERRALLWGVVVVLLVIGGGAGLFVATGGGAGPGKTEPPKTEPPKTEPPKTEPPKTEPPKTEPPKTEPPKTEPDPTIQARLDELKTQLAGFGDPPPPAACTPEASAAAAELVLAAREAIASDAARAIEDATKAIERCPSFAAAHNVHGNALQKTERLEDAADAYARALTFAADYEAPRFNLGVVQLRRKDPAAIATFGELIRRKPDHADAYKSRAQAYLNAQRYEEGLADLEEGLKRAPDDGRAWLIVGQLRDKLKRSGARDAYCKARELGIEEAAKRCGK